MEKTRASYRFCLYGLIILGIALRFHQYLINRSLWFDEVCLVLNLVDRSFLELLEPLDYSQGAPIGFLLLTKLLIWLLGHSEYVLRILPLLSGILSLFIFPRVAKEYLSKESVLPALALFVVSDRLIYYSSEVKQYSSDVLVGLCLLLLLPAIQKSDLKVSSLFLFGLVGAIAIWFSHPAVFILASIGLVSLLFLEKSFKKISRLGLVYFVWALSFALFYFFSLKILVTNQKLTSYWNYAFMPTNDLIAAFEWLVVTLVGFFIDPLVLSSLWFSMSLLGAIRLFVRNKRSFLALGLPIVFVLFASALGKYPFASRLVLFLVPFFLLFIAEGVVQTVVSLRLPWLTIALLTIIFLLDPLRIAFGHLVFARTREEARPVLEFIRNNKKPGDKVYVYYGAKKAWQFYADDYGLNSLSHVFGVASRDNWDAYIKDLENLEGPRVWFLFSHVCFWVKGNEEKFFVDYLDKIGKRKKHFRIPEVIIRSKKIILPGTSVYLYELHRSKESPCGQDFDRGIEGIGNQRNEEEKNKDLRQN